MEPQFRIRVNAVKVAEEQRGAYDVLAFEGNCRLTQGELEASADEIVLWIERSSPGIEHPGKIICYLNGRAEVSWGDGRQVRDHRWMGRLFSIHPIDYHCEQKIRRHDIPNLDWNREPGGPVQLAQFSQPTSGNAFPTPDLTAPPLLGQTSSNSFGVLPAAPTPGANIPQVPQVPGSVIWNADGNQSQTGGTSNSEYFPQGGLVVPNDGTLPYPAAGQAEEIQSTPMAPAFPAPTPQVVLQPPAPNPYAAKSLQLLPRSASSPPNVSFTFQPERGESIGQITGGFKLVVAGIQIAQADGSMADFGSVSLEADNAVVWVRGNEPINAMNLQSTPDRPIELYLDGNIVFYQGNRVIYADRMYYNVSSEYGMVLSAEVLTPVPQYQGLLRLKADVLKQQDRQNFMAYGAAITSSRMGVPSYWLQGNEVELKDTRNEADMSLFGPSDITRPTHMQATAKSNFVYVGGLPVFYWPIFKTNLSEPSFYLSSLRFRNDSIFGFQVYSEFNAFHILGIDAPQGTSLRLSADYLSKRGPAGGYRFDYNRPTWFFGAPGVGFSDGWFISDQGLDTLGSDRVDLFPEEGSTRGRIWSRNRLYLSPNTELIGETGWISDRNFLEQYFEQEWEQEKDFATSLRFRHYKGPQVLDIWGQIRVNDFFTETETLPRIDHYWLGQDLFAERFTWSAHTSVGYVHQKVASTPTNPADAAKFELLPWETDSEGLRATTRQELSMPVSLGDWRVIPFISGEAGFWNEDINQEDQTRLTGQAGVRAALPFWKVYPNVENRLFDLRGLAHKVTLASEFFYADSNKDIDLFPLYDPVDDNSQEHFRRRLIFNTFGGTQPPQFDERSYALRNGMQRWVTAPGEIMDDLSQLRMGVNQRLQTKRGLPGQERIVDLVALDVDFIYFPKPERDNFGEDVGAINYDFRYHVGDRLTLLSDGYFDTFSQGLKAISAGAQISRPGRGDAYLGMLSMEGPISANVLNGFVNYRMNDKWILSGGAAFDFSSAGSIGQNLALTRIGETALVRVGVTNDTGRNNVTFNFNIEPRFLPTSRLGVIGGELIPPAGLFGLE